MSPWLELVFAPALGRLKRAFCNSSILVELSKNKLLFSSNEIQFNKAKRLPLMKSNQTKPSRMTRNNFQIVFSLFFTVLCTVSRKGFNKKIQEKQNKPGHNTQGYVHALVMTRVLKTQRLEIWKNRPKLSQHSTASTASWALVSAAASKAGAAAAARRSPKSAGGAKPYARHCPFTGDDRHRHPRQIVVASPPSPSNDCRSPAADAATAARLGQLY